MYVVILLLRAFDGMDYSMECAAQPIKRSVARTSIEGSAGDGQHSVAQETDRRYITILNIDVIFTFISFGC